MAGHQATRLQYKHAKRKNIHQPPQHVKHGPELAPGPRPTASLPVPIRGRALSLLRVLRSANAVARWHEALTVGIKAPEHLALYAF